MYVVYLLRCSLAFVLTRNLVYTLFADEPLREGKHWWLGVEMIRIVVLSSTIGFLARQCWMKILAAQLLALAWMILFIYNRPCTFPVILFCN